MWPWRFEARKSTQLSTRKRSFPDLKKKEGHRRTPLLSNTARHHTTRQQDPRQRRGRTPCWCPKTGQQAIEFQPASRSDDVGYSGAWLCWNTVLTDQQHIIQGRMLVSKHAAGALDQNGGMDKDTAGIELHAPKGHSTPKSEPGSRTWKRTALPKNTIQAARLWAALRC